MAKVGTSCPYGLIRATALMAALEIEDREPHLFGTAHLASTALVLLYISVCVSSYCFIFLYMSPRTESPTLSLLATGFNCTGPRTRLYLCVSSYCCIFVCVLVLLYV